MANGAGRTNLHICVNDFLNFQGRSIPFLQMTISVFADFNNPKDIMQKTSRSTLPRFYKCLGERPISKQMGNNSF